MTDVLCEGHKEPLMVKFADGGNKKRLQYNTWISTNDPDVSDAAVIAMTVTETAGNLLITS